MAGHLETQFFDLIMKYSPDERPEDAWEAAHNCARAIQERGLAGAAGGGAVGGLLATESVGLSIIIGAAAGGSVGVYSGYKSESCAEVREGVRLWRQDVWSQIQSLIDFDQEFTQ